MGDTIFEFADTSLVFDMSKFMLFLIDMFAPHHITLFRSITVDWDAGSMPRNIIECGEHSVD